MLKEYSCNKCKTVFGNAKALKLHVTHCDIDVVTRTSREVKRLRKFADFEDIGESLTQPDTDDDADSDSAPEVESAESDSTAQFSDESHDENESVEQESGGTHPMDQTVDRSPFFSAIGLDDINWPSRNFATLSRIVSRHNMSTREVDLLLQDIQQLDFSAGAR